MRRSTKRPISRSSRNRPYAKIQRLSHSSSELHVLSEDRIIKVDSLYECEDETAAELETQSTTESIWHQELGVNGEEHKIKWQSLKHNGPVFAPSYTRLPTNVKFYYNSTQMELSDVGEEAATHFAKLLNTNLMKSPLFKRNFFKSFTALLEPTQRKIVRRFTLCNFQNIYDYCQSESEIKSRRRRELRLELKRQQEQEKEKFGYCEIDGQREQIANYRVESPGIFHGRGNHPLIGTLKPRIQPEDVTINCSPDCTPAAPVGHSWGRILHNNNLSWLARWRDSISGKPKYIWLSSASRLEGIRDLNKFEKARRLSLHIRQIRHSYEEDWHSEDLRLRQRGVALYLIDRLMLRVGNEKQENTADTEGCCTLRVEHLKLCTKLSGVPNVVVFNFLGKDSVKFYRKIALNTVAFSNLRSFVRGKNKIDLVFDLLIAKYLNRHLNMLMEGLTAKVFRTYNASKLLQQRLKSHTFPSQSLKEKLETYRNANAEAAQFCNHQRAMTKTFSLKLLNWQKQIEDKKVEIVKLKKRIRINIQRQSKMARTKQLQKLQSEVYQIKAKMSEASVKSKISLSTTKVNYLDPRITVAWCQRNEVPIDKVYSQTLCKKFKWAIRATNEDFHF